MEKVKFKDMLKHSVFGMGGFIFAMLGVLGVATISKNIVVSFNIWEILVGLGMIFVGMIGVIAFIVKIQNL